ncbi:MAG: hydrogenase maturation nickel metallochaperone HypA [Deltaproteobacteria bacterium]|nr:hydrogenase maturation nickel metallochaperone HypA [Deltaproteobacteria bacterium]
MHEASMIRDLVLKIEQIAKEQSAESVSVVRVKLGALSHCSAEHFREHFEQEALGTCAENALLEIEELSDERDEKLAQAILLDSVDLK